MGRIRFAAVAAVLFIAVAAAFSFSVSDAFAQCAAANGSNSASGSGFVGGGQLGYNWQQGSWVYGVETDLSGTSLKSSMSGGLSTGGCLTDAANTSANVDWYGTLRGRAGWANGPILFYGTAGLAYGKVDLNSTFNGLGLSTTAQVSSTRADWVIGAGIEYLLQPNLSLNLGYQYVDLGTLSLTSTTTSGGGSFATQTASTHAAFHVATLGLSWRFSPTGMAPWQGMYGGGHAGGAWGESTNANYTSGFPFSDARLKRDITLVGRLDDGLGLYQYRYLWSDTVYVGVMAQEVALIHPEAVVRDGLDKYLRVDYGRLGLKLMTRQEWDAQSKGVRL
jgi:opacity protein-like surface antigen